MKKSIITLVILAFTFSVNAQDWWGNGKRIKGNGNVVTKTRTVSDYDGISVGGSFDVVLVKGKEGEITIKGEENIIPYIITEVKSGTLKVKYKKNTNIRTTKRLTVTVPFKAIEKVSLGGSGNIRSESVIKADELSVGLGGSGDIKLVIEANELSAKIGGSGNIKLEGNAKEFNSSIAGSGSIKAYGVKASIANANIAGSGNVRITVTDKIKAKVVGSGNIYYKGDPAKIDIKSVGSGDVIDRN